MDEGGIRKISISYFNPMTTLSSHEPAFFYVYQSSISEVGESCTSHRGKRFKRLCNQRGELCCPWNQMVSTPAFVGINSLRLFYTAIWQRIFFFIFMRLKPIPRWLGERLRASYFLSFTLIYRLVSRQKPRTW